MVSALLAQVGSSVCGSVRTPVRLRPVLLCNPGGPWAGVPRNSGQLPHLRERHHVVEHERQHSVHTAQGSCAVCHLYTARYQESFLVSRIKFESIYTVWVYHIYSYFVSIQLFCWWSWCTLWWELPGSSSITSRALMSLPKTWLWVSKRTKKRDPSECCTGLFHKNLHYFCRNCCLQLACDTQCLHYPHVHV